MLCQEMHSEVRRFAEGEMVLSFPGGWVGCDDNLGCWDVSVGKVELKQDWFGLVWVGRGDWTGLDRTDWFVKGGRRSQAGWSRRSKAGQGRAG